ncbi:hypothetical protein PQY08_002666 [Salmonella enterica]|nr:hypothetical protein [Salmonella enterica]EBL8181123.1 hypothetical protein [Salmonella enterica]EJG3779910.1 hypothetical protein [Salmonella enterica]EJM0401721.1 hypothetical protein [Salmonella enterica]EKH2729780.1 hypothetical protein [Salmonella enterica]
MKDKLTIMFITLHDDGISIQTDDGVAGYHWNGNISVFSGVDKSLIPDGVIFHDHRQKNDSMLSEQ